LIGVSPAYYISNNTSHFKLSDVIDSLSWMSENSFGAIQLEVFHYAQLNEWNYTNLSLLKEELIKNNIVVSQFVAHFLMNCFESLDSISSDNGLEELRFLSAILKHFSLTKTITIPIPPYKDERDGRELDLFYIKVSKAVKICGDYGFKVALEPQPKSLAADLDYLNKIDGIGLNLDPGHILCSGIDPFNLDKKILSKVYATHLCENDGVVNNSLVPGYEITEERWENLISGLIDAGFENSFDVEIICEKNLVETEYKKGNFFLENICIQNNRYRGTI